MVEKYIDYLIEIFKLSDDGFRSIRIGQLSRRKETLLKLNIKEAERRCFETHRILSKKHPETMKGSMDYYQFKRSVIIRSIT